MNFCALVLALPYSTNLKIMIAQETTEKINRSIRANFPTGVVSASSAIRPLPLPLWAAEPNKVIKSRFFILSIYHKSGNNASV